jgi:hypothetical protein
VPDERPIPDLPIERPNFQLLFGTDPGPSSSTYDAAEKGDISASVNSSLKGKEKASDNVVRRTQVGGGDVDVTDKLTMTWVSDLSITPPGGGNAATILMAAWAIYLLCDP